MSRKASLIQNQSSLAIRPLGQVNLTTAIHGSSSSPRRPSFPSLLVNDAVTCNAETQPQRAKESTSSGGKDEATSKSSVQEAKPNQAAATADLHRLCNARLDKLRHELKEARQRLSDEQSITVQQREKVEQLERVQVDMQSRLDRTSDELIGVHVEKRRVETRVDELERQTAAWQRTHAESQQKHVQQMEQTRGDHLAELHRLDGEHRAEIARLNERNEFLKSQVSQNFLGQSWERQQQIEMLAKKLEKAADDNEILRTKLRQNINRQHQHTQAATHKSGKHCTTATNSFEGGEKCGGTGLQSDKTRDFEEAAGSLAQCANCEAVQQRLNEKSAELGRLHLELESLKKKLQTMTALCHKGRSAPINR